MQPAGFATQLLLGLGDSCGQPDRAPGLGYVAQFAGERGPLVIGDRTAGELVARLAGKRAKRLVIEVIERGADDAAVAHQASQRQVQQTGQQLASSEIASRTEQHDHVRLHGCHQGRDDVAGIGVGCHMLGH